MSHNNGELVETMGKNEFGSDSGTAEVRLWTITAHKRQVATELDLAEFLLARLSEDEETARTATPGRWQATEGSAGLYYPPDTFYVDAESRNVANASSTGDIKPADAHHIALFDPTRALAEAEAKRRIVELWRAAQDRAEHLQVYPAGYRRGYQAQAAALLQALSEIGAIYSDHPDYQQIWAPS